MATYMLDKYGSVWKFTRTDLNAILARMRDRWAQSQPLKLAA